MRLILVAIVTILICYVHYVIGYKPGGRYLYTRYKNARRRQARQIFIQPHPSACYDSPCQNGATCEWMDVPITCDCAVGFTGDLCEININECISSPCSYGPQSRCVDYINEYACECPIGYGGSECLTELNECESDPCQNGGRCIDRFNGYTCSCAAGFTGAVCEINIDDCLSSPCQHQGECTDSVNSFFCSCKPGFQGSLCETDINECAALPCQNGGRCIDLINRFECVCAKGFHGPLCAQAQLSCRSYPCLNGGRCIEKRQGYECQCQTGYRGVNCLLAIDECSQNPCRNGGRCYNLVNGFFCTCLPGFKGKQCEQELRRCSNSKCLNGGTCESDREFTYCICTEGYSGGICQFHEKDYSVRLVGGKSDNEGRVEVYYRNKWGPIADSAWTLEDASTVCHHLGFHSAIEAFSHSEYGNSNDPAQICEMVCSGNEHVIHDCVLDQPAADVGCQHKAHVGVICTDVASPCQASWRSWSTSCYYVDPKPRTWDDANSNCQKKGASLVHIESELENEFLREHVEKNHGGYPATWIGLSDSTKEGDFTWLRNQNNSFTNWNLGEPNNGGVTAIIRTSKSVMMSTYDETTGGENCVELLTINGKWNDIECSMKRPSVCETVQETMTSVKKMSPGLIAVISVIVIVFIVGGVITAGLIIT
ncbi:neurogenic locus notch homolog protein 2-like [Anneissia japonica]|uniref:neurogenic locus notch homolog protein 2-like n=1 Tax=Anneissia japonica TaxID=1529436 RepID=UPI001425970D|nr:neurogenic locus notch homolog protein 2-like [Anneissia japonica]